MLTKLELDASGLIFGRFCSRVACALMSKDNPNEVGKKLVIIKNASKVVFSGNKKSDKQICSYSGYAGGLKRTTPLKLIEENKTERLFKRSVKNMLPKNKLYRKLLRENLIVEE